MDSASLFLLLSLSLTLSNSLSISFLEFFSVSLGIWPHFRSRLSAAKQPSTASLSSFSFYLYFPICCFSSCRCCRCWRISVQVQLQIRRGHNTIKWHVCCPSPAPAPSPAPSPSATISKMFAQQSERHKEKSWRCRAAKSSAKQIDIAARKNIQDVQSRLQLCISAYSIIISIH